MINSTKNQGFTTVELLISLFIAAAFIATAFQLFSVVTKDSNEARLRSLAATEANAIIQKRSNAATSPCTTLPAATDAIPTAKLPQASASTTFTCPYGTSAKTTRITTTITYGTPAVTVMRSLDVNR